MLRQRVAASLVPGEPAAVLLQGFNLSMACVAQPGTPCNGNGAWIYHLNLTLASCPAAGPASGPAECELTFELFRAWAPLGGGGKPYNPVMAYELRVFAGVLSGADVQVERPAVVRPAAQPLGRAPAAGQVQGPSPLGPAAHATVLSGLAGFAWTLEANPAFPQRGRYLEEYAFGITAPAHQPNRTSSFAWTAGLRSPADTTFPCSVAT